MGYAQHAEAANEQAASQAERARHRDVPQDWFLDPASPAARETALDEAATAFLAAHEAGLLTDAAPRLLSEGFADTSPGLEAPSTDDAASFWDAVAPFADDEGGVLAWQAQALCAQTDPEAFFPEKGGSTRDAKRVCSGCSVRQECLDYALANDERFGIWGGLSERERRRIRRDGR
ncbi:WhiB family transcriptional regulator [Falsarthrobacter nasiphocae]|uniref:Transcriptional regulator WhiB n=1 Tax=Falsarthrobacter nasiphocae TaxID=189863 RepID=A0AAE3YGL0_9MICC|nr:WhiB family transcriptional regulator [Falsarthrobacter nasiphocae]MDR6891626.1 WhiB family redox-sensing transcriptional regulator [Falsarthrobacter nasiphocae]